MKAAAKQSLCKKLVKVLRKRYKKPLPKTDRPVLDILLYAVCLENASPETAEASCKRLISRFHDFNEMRVSSLSELEPVFNGSDQPEYRALRIRSILQAVFEMYYAFDFETLRKKTLEAAAKELGKFPYLSDFVRDYTLQCALEAHLLPLDERMKNAAVWLGLVSPDVTPREAGESLKSIVRKTDGPQFCHLLRYLATDAAFVRFFESACRKPPEEGFDPLTAVDRLEEIIRSAGKRRRAGKKVVRGSRTGSAARRKTKKKKTKVTRGRRTKPVGRKTKKKTKRSLRSR